MSSALQESHLASGAGAGEERDTSTFEKRARCELSGGDIGDGELATGKRPRKVTPHEEVSQSSDSFGIFVTGDGSMDTESKSNEVPIVDGSNEESEKKLEVLNFIDSGQRGSAKGEKVLRCNICNVYCHDEKGLHAHGQGKKHKKRQQLDRKTELEVCEKVALDTVKKQFICHACHVKCNSQRNYEQHASGKKHCACLKKLSMERSKSDMEVNAEPENGYGLKVSEDKVTNQEGACGGSGDKSVREFSLENNELTDLRSALDLVLLHSGMQIPKKGSTLETDLAIKVYDLCAHDCGQNLGDNGYVMMHVDCFLKLLKSEYFPGDQQHTVASNSWICRVCGLELGEKADHKNHILGKKHVAKLKKLQLRCDICSVNCSISKTMESHLAGKVHNSKLRRAQKTVLYEIHG